MKLIAATLIIFASIFQFQKASARDERMKFSIKDALNNTDAKARLSHDVKFYFGKQKHPKVAQSFGEFQSNKKTNAFGKSDLKACNWAFLSAMRSFEQRAKSLGGNAVINIKSYYKKNIFESETMYECGAGTIMAGVTFKGEVVKLSDSQLSSNTDNSPTPTNSKKSSPLKKEK